jgi:hypothetical protein
MSSFPPKASKTPFSEVFEAFSVFLTTGEEIQKPAETKMIHHPCFAFASLPRNLLLGPFAFMEEIAHLLVGVGAVALNLSLDCLPASLEVRVTHHGLSPPGSHGVPPIRRGGA